MSEATLATEQVLQKERKPRQRRWWHNDRVRFGLGLFIFFGLVALFAPVVAPLDPLKQEPQHWLSGPSTHNLLGADEFGRDVLSRLIYGARLSLGVAISSVLFAAIIGIMLGLVAAYYGGLVDTVIMRFMDLMFAFPAILFAIAIVAFLGPSIRNLIITIALLYVPRFARVVYSSALTTKNEAFVEASRAVGAKDFYLIWRIILPNIMAPIFVQSSLALGFAILLESGLSFIGLGAQPPTPSWGEMIASGRALMEREPLLVVWPSLVIALNIIAFNVLGDGLRDALDPRLRNR